MSKAIEVPPRPAAVPAEAEYLAFIYAGRREGKDGMVDEIIPLVNGAPGKDRWFKSTKAERILGGVYVGAWFTEGQCWGLGAARYDHRWDKASDLMKWEALNDHTKSAARRAKLEQDAKRKSFIDEQMIELRRLYTDMRKRGDHVGCIALESAVQVSLRRRTET